MSPILGIWASKYTQGTNFESITTATVTSGGQATITFSSIPQTYTHLQIRAICRSEGAYTSRDSIMQFNGDTGANYKGHYLYTDGSTVAASGGSAIQPFYMPGASRTAGMFAPAVCDILDYTNTNKYKTVRSLTGMDVNGNGELLLRSGLWMSTSAISSISITVDVSVNFAQYTQFALYGVK